MFIFSILVSYDSQQSAVWVGDSVKPDRSSSGWEGQTLNLEQLHRAVYSRSLGTEVRLKHSRGKEKQNNTTLRQQVMHKQVYNKLCTIHE